MKSYKIACIPGDGIGKEVVPAGQTVLEALAAADGRLRFEFTTFDWGGDYYRKHGVMMPADGLDGSATRTRSCSARPGDPDIPDHITLWGLRLAICQGFDQYANVRPTRILPGHRVAAASAAGRRPGLGHRARESEGEYSGVGGRAHQGQPIEVATDVSMMTRAGVERIMRFAFRLAQSRPRKLLTVVTKSNAQRHAMVMWDEIACEVARDSRRALGQGTGRCVRRAMINRPARSTRSSPPTCMPTSCPIWLRALRKPGHRADGQHRSGAPLPVDVRADPWLGFDIMGKVWRIRSAPSGVASCCSDTWANRRRGATDARYRTDHGDPALHTGDLGGTATDRPGDRRGMCAVCSRRHEKEQAPPQNSDRLMRGSQPGKYPQ
jgi:tartrate dehydrogenase/decarboxylase/D-malate dehydrogenase